ncbi:1,2-dihydroxy-3-keto-5-methylthiopentene dioxygenase [Ceratitis capitata]|uniref:1,2-dihydroxy-3-keto-5-methylthiopentene dioxygenase n=1 Tax=Ceratitis capitata TaxID=7213 RepID=UPI000329F3B9|nr:1,2-dihydroxy-3-keto-5-methylthiopentene dioxygenase [Ceratitis capitata]
MVRVWYMDEEQTDPRLDHKKTPSENVSMEDLYKKTGVEYFHIDADNFRNDALLKQIREDRNYSYEDEVTIAKDTLPDFEAKLKTFYTEHLHTDEEIRLVLDGSGYFDVRDEADKWIRIEVDKNDLIIIPAGIYHRFTLDMKNYIKAKRYFVGEPIWLPYNRPADDMECRKKYLHDQSRLISECAQ